MGEACVEYIGDKRGYLPGDGPHGAKPNQEGVKPSLCSPLYTTRHAGGGK